MQLIGAHVSMAGGVENAPLNAKDLGLETFQMFARNPRGGGAKPYTEEQISLFKERMAEFGFTRSYIHTPYFINLASAKPRIYHGSISAIREDLERGSLLGSTAIMTHIGSAKDLGKEEAMEQVREGIGKILEGYEGETELLLEISAGAGEIIGDTFEELAYLIAPYGIGICYDTQHGFASGYDIRTPETTDKVLKEFEKHIGLKNMRMTHLNDSKVEFAAKKDRHEHIGEGHIGKEGLKNFLTDPRTEHIDVILETPHDEKLQADIDFLKSLR